MAAGLPKKVGQGIPCPYWSDQLVTKILKCHLDKYQTVFNTKGFLQMQRATKDTLYFETGADNPVTLRVQPGETFEVETQMNRGPWLDTHPDGERLRQALRGGNPSSGCI